jgi:hypothetical protein
VSAGGKIKGDWTSLIISGGSCDQGFTPVEDLPLLEGRGEFDVVSIDCFVSRFECAALVTASVNP